MGDSFQDGERTRRSTRIQTEKSIQDETLRRMERQLTKNLASPQKRREVAELLNPQARTSRKNFEAAQSAVNAAVLRKLDRALALQLMAELPGSMPRDRRDAALAKYKAFKLIDNARNLKRRLEVIYPAQERLRRELYKARVAKQRRYAQVNKVRNANIAALNAAGYYDNRNNFQGSGLYRRKRPKRRVYSKINRYLGKKPRRSKKRTLRSLISSIANRRRRC